jgi:hypothetical protein
VNHSVVSRTSCEGCRCEFEEAMRIKKENPKNIVWLEMGEDCHIFLKAKNESGKVIVE